MQSALDRLKVICQERWERRKAVLFARFQGKKFHCFLFDWTSIEPLACSTCTSNIEPGDHFWCAYEEDLHEGPFTLCKTCRVEMMSS